MHRDDLLPRPIAARLRAALGRAPVVLLVGPRQSGKTTLVREVIAGGHAATYVSLDEPGPLAAASADPDGFLAAYRAPLAIDEVQRVPDLLRAVKVFVDRDRRPGRFLLTGSANVLLLPRVSESLAGRVEIITLLPLSQGEIERREEHFIERVFSGSWPLIGSDEDIASLIARAARGGYPEAVSRAEGDRPAWFDSYVATVLQRDVRELANVERLAEIPRLLELLAARAMTILNVAEVGRAMEMSKMTLSRYLALLENIYFVERVPAWSGSLARRVTRHPKLLILDSGLLAQLQRVDRRRFAYEPTLAGPILEDLVASELLKQAARIVSGPRLLHFRTHAGDEVDLVLERSDGAVVGIEVKAASAAGAADFRGLRALASATGRKFRAGLVLNAGRETVPFGPRLWSAPIAAVWSVGPDLVDRVQAKGDLNEQTAMDLAITEVHAARRGKPQG